MFPVRIAQTFGTSITNRCYLQIFRFTQVFQERIDQRPCLVLLQGCQRRI